MKIYTNDIINFLKKTTVKKVVNAFLVLLSFQLTRIFKRPIQWGTPFTVSFEPTTACNLKCPECPSGLRSFNRPTGNLKHDFFKDIMDDISGKLFYLIFYFQGEPYINPEFLNMVKYAHSKGIYTITSTNGHFLNDKNSKATIESGLDRVIISIDGLTQETYQSYRIGGKLENVIAGAKNLVKWKRELNSTTPHIIFQFLVVKPNEHEIADLYKLADSIGIDEVKLKTAQVYDYKNGNSLIPTIDKYSRYKKEEDGTYTVKHSLVNRCWKLWHSCVITWDGKVVPCCFDKDADHRMGDLKQEGFESIWNNNNYNSFRNKISEGRDKIDICSNCSEGCKVFH